MTFSLQKLIQIMYIFYLFIHLYIYLPTHKLTDDDSYDWKI
jgi:hypothetical protein